MTVNFGVQKIGRKLALMGAILGMGVLVATVSTATVQAANCDASTYRYGSSGWCVMKIQDLLNYMGGIGGAIAEDGQFGPKTKAKVVDFQQQERIGDDGIVGPITWSRLCDPWHTWVNQALNHYNSAKSAGCFN